MKKQREWIYHPTKDFTTIVFFTFFALLAAGAGLYETLWPIEVRSVLDFELFQTRRGTGVTIVTLGITVLSIVDYWIIRRMKNKGFYHEDTVDSLDGPDLFLSAVVTFGLFLLLTLIMYFL